MKKSKRICSKCGEVEICSSKSPLKKCSRNGCYGYLFLPRSKKTKIRNSFCFYPDVTIELSATPPYKKLRAIGITVKQWASSLSIHHYYEWRGRLYQVNAINEFQGLVALASSLGIWLISDDDAARILNKIPHKTKALAAIRLIGPSDYGIFSPICQGWYCLREITKYFFSCHNRRRCHLCNRRIDYSWSKENTFNFYLSPDRRMEPSLYVCSRECAWQLIDGLTREELCRQRQQDRLKRQSEQMEEETIRNCKKQIKALRGYLKTSNLEVLQSLPKGYGPATTSPK